MSDLIHKGELFNALANAHDKGEIFAIIQNAPTVEPVPTKSQFKRMAVQLGYEPVVYCDVCVKRGTRHCPIYPKENGDDFCSYGGRRTDD